MKFVRKTLTTLGLTIAIAVGASMTNQEALASTQTGIASWYQMGTRTANGEAYRPDGMTAAHRTLPFGTIVEVKNLRNGRTARLRINDRGPFIGGRIIDVSRGGARQLGLMGSGTARVRVTTLGRGSIAHHQSSKSGGLACVFNSCY